MFWSPLPTEFSCRTSNKPRHRTEHASSKGLKRRCFRNHDFERDADDYALQLGSLPLRIRQLFMSSELLVGNLGESSGDYEAEPRSCLPPVRVPLNAGTDGPSLTPLSAATALRAGTRSIATRALLT